MTTETDPRLVEIARSLAELLPQGANNREEQLAEQLDLAQRQLDRFKQEDWGWQAIFGGNDKRVGPELDWLKESSEILRAAVAESPLPKRANELRSSYVFSEKFIIPNLEGSTETSTNADGTKKRGPKTGDVKVQQALKDFAASRTAREYVFGKNAQELISTACSTDGMYLLLGDNKTKEVHAIPIADIDDIMVNPEHPGEVWAYKRTWNPNPSKENVKDTSRWYYTDRFVGRKKATIAKTTVDPDKTMIDLTVNTQSGWALGVPDLWAGHVWNRNYLTAMLDGMEVTSLMAWLSAKVKKQSQAGSNAAGVKIGAGGPAGSVQTYGEGNSIDTYATTGKGYDFAGLNPIAAIYSLSCGVSLVDLLASPSASGGSYGAAQALSPGLRRAIAVRRDKIAGWLERVLEWATTGYHRVTPASIEEETPYRRMQMLALANTSGLFHEDEIRPEIAYLASITLKHDSAPEGYLIPNNKESWERGDIDPKDGPAGSTTSTASPTQGKGDGTGGVGNTSGNDVRDDTLD